MTQEQRSRANELLARLTQLSIDIDIFGTETFGANDSHPIWQVWHPVSTAEARLKQLISESTD